MNFLNNAIWNKEKNEGIEGFSSSYHIGASYFLNLKNYKADSDKGFNSLWNYHLEPLLREYLRGMDDAEEKLNKLKEVYKSQF